MEFTKHSEHLIYFVLACAFLFICLWAFVIWFFHFLDKRTEEKSRDIEANESYIICPGCGKKQPTFFITKTGICFNCANDIHKAKALKNG